MASSTWGRADFSLPRQSQDDDSLLQRCSRGHLRIERGYRRLKNFRSTRYDAHGDELLSRPWLLRLSSHTGTGSVPPLEPFRTWVEPHFKPGRVQGAYDHFFIKNLERTE